MGGHRASPALDPLVGAAHVGIVASDGARRRGAALQGLRTALEALQQRGLLVLPAFELLDYACEAVQPSRQLLQSLDNGDNL